MGRCHSTEDQVLWPIPVVYLRRLIEIGRREGVCIEEIKDIVPRGINYGYAYPRITERYKSHCRTIGSISFHLHLVNLEGRDCFYFTGEQYRKISQLLWRVVLDD